MIDRSFFRFLTAVWIDIDTEGLAQCLAVLSADAADDISADRIIPAGGDAIAFEGKRQLEVRL